MTEAEILREIQQLPPTEQRALSNQLKESLPELVAQDDNPDRREREFELAMLSEGFFVQIPTGTMTDTEFDEYELPENEGESLSEQIIRERI